MDFIVGMIVVGVLLWPVIGFLESERKFYRDRCFHAERRLMDFCVVRHPDASEYDLAALEKD